ncbi:MOSC domain-containing protein [Halopiger thermotolerans]
MNGKREPKIHQIESEFDPATSTLTVYEVTNAERSRYDLTNPAERTELENVLSDFFDYSVRIKRDSEGGFPDDTVASGPTVISRSTLETVSSWFDGIDIDEMRRRLRPNIEIRGVPPFWEDKLYADKSHAVRFAIGGAELCGSNPCSRCVVPTRDPDTGEEYPEFKKIFVRRRKETLPEWATEDWFDHYFRLMVNTAVPQSEWKKSIEVGDSVRILERTEGSVQST